MEQEIHTVNGLAERGRFGDIPAKDLDITFPECRGVGRGTDKDSNTNTLVQEGIDHMPTNKPCSPGH